MKKLHILLIPSLLTTTPFSFITFVGCSNENPNLKCYATDIEVNYEGLCSFYFDLNHQLENNQHLTVQARVLNASKDVTIINIDEPIVNKHNVSVNLKVTGFCQQNDFAQIELLFVNLDNNKMVVWEQKFDNLRIIYGEAVGPIINELWNIQNVDGKQTLLGFASSSTTGKELSPDEIKQMMVDHQTTHLVIPKTVECVVDDAFIEAEYPQPTKLPSDYINLVTFEKDSQCTMIGKNFLNQFKGANNWFVCLPKNLLTIGDGFLSGSNINNIIIIPNKITQIPHSFLASCFQFNNQISLPEGIIDIASGFLTGNEVFNQPLVLPKNLKTIGASFLNWCPNFNQPIIIPDGVTVIEPGFLCNCASFNSPIVLPPALTEIKADFLAKNKVFNQPIIIPETVTNIGEDFLSMSIAFNQPLTFSADLKRIGANCLYGCNSLTSAITINTPIQFIAGHDQPNDTKSFAANLPNALSFITGMTIRGVTAEQVKSSFVYKYDETQNIYRNLK